MWSTSLRFHKRARAWIRFVRARKGNVAITFAIALIPILALVGAAVDFSRANSLKAAMQMAIDSTALMVSKNAATLTSSQMQSSAQDYFRAVFNRPEAKNVTITAINITVNSITKWGSARLRVALVLDTTGSMSSDGKIGALKTATKNLLDQLQSAASVNGDVYVSIIPFSKNVVRNPPIGIRSGQARPVHSPRPATASGAQQGRSTTARRLPGFHRAVPMPVIFVLTSTAAIRSRGSSASIVTAATTVCRRPRRRPEPSAPAGGVTAAISAIVPVPAAGTAESAGRP